MNRIKKIFWIILCLLIMSGCTSDVGQNKVDEDIKNTESSTMAEVAEDTEHIEKIESTEGVDATEYEDFSENVETTEDIDGKDDKETQEDFGELQVHFLDVGQGDSTLIMCNGHAMLIDAGGNDKGTYVQNYLKKAKVKKLDYVIGTHPDADHIGGLDVVLYKFDCTHVFMPDIANDTNTYRDVVDVIEEKNYKAFCPKVGEEYSLDKAKFTVIAPNGSYGNQTNDYSIGIKLEFGDKAFVFTGDAEEAAEWDIISNGISLDADVLKIAHHGSRNATTEMFLDRVNPEYAVISVGEDNSYGHPTAEVLNRLRTRKIKLFRTDEQGTIIASCDGNEIVWNCSPTDTWKAGEQSKSDSDLVGDNKNNESGGHYVINKNTKKFHYSDCSSVSDMKEKNKLENDWSRDEIISKGYVPCKRCNP